MSKKNVRVVGLLKWNRNSLKHEKDKENSNKVSDNTYSIIFKTSKRYIYINRIRLRSLYFT